MNILLDFIFVCARKFWMCISTGGVDSTAPPAKYDFSFFSPSTLYTILSKCGPSKNIINITHITCSVKWDSTHTHTMHLRYIQMHYISNSACTKLNHYQKTSLKMSIPATDKHGQIGCLYPRLYSSAVPGNVCEESLSAADLERKNCRLQRRLIKQSVSDDFILSWSRKLISVRISSQSKKIIQSRNVRSSSAFVILPFSRVIRCKYILTIFRSMSTQISPATEDIAYSVRPLSLTRPKYSSPKPTPCLLNRVPLWLQPTLCCPHTVTKNYEILNYRN